MQKLWDEKALFLHKILDGKVRLVGGCVRDFLLHKRFEDRDMATTLTPDEVVARLEKNKIPYLDIGRAFGTIAAKVDGTPFEITTLRKDIKTDGRHAVVGFTKSWATDARRRDFTINALYADTKGKIYDYVGCIYPEGFISYKENLVFDQTRIDEIISLGYKNDDWVEAEKVIKQCVKELESEKKNE